MKYIAVKNAQITWTPSVFVRASAGRRIHGDPGDPGVAISSSDSEH